MAVVQVGIVGVQVEMVVVQVGMAGFRLFEFVIRC